MSSARVPREWNGNWHESEFVLEKKTENENITYILLCDGILFDRPLNGPLKRQKAVSFNILLGPRQLKLHRKVNWLLLLNSTGRAAESKTNGSRNRFSRPRPLLGFKTVTFLHAEVIEA
jgi:hypothetical protein